MPNYASRPRTNYIVVHCAATPPQLDIGVEEIRKWHTDKGWIDVGYHYVIRRDGTEEIGRPADVMGAHVRGHNDESIAVCLVGGVDEYNAPENNFTYLQWETLKSRVSLLQSIYPEAEVVGHNQLDPHKACPSFDVQDWLSEELSRESALVDVAEIIYRKMTGYPDHSEIYSALKDVLNEVGDLT
jgi:N-acetyl-anhydromuramyl-L-alanine amidase AmpD